MDIKRLLRSAHHRTSARYLVLHPEPFFMAYKSLCRIESLVFPVPFSYTGWLQPFSFLHREPFFLLTQDLSLLSVMVLIGES